MRVLPQSGARMVTTAEGRRREETSENLSGYVSKRSAKRRTVFDEPVSNNFQHRQPTGRLHGSGTSNRLAVRKSRPVTSHAVRDSLPLRAFVSFIYSG